MANVVRKTYSNAFVDYILKYLVLKARFGNYNWHGKRMLDKYRCTCCIIRDLYQGFLILKRLLMMYLLRKQNVEIKLWIF